jgi:TRAP-type C4-dicarboxylate transport system permease small subunit
MFLKTLVKPFNTSKFIIIDLSLHIYRSKFFESKHYFSNFLSRSYMYYTLPFILTVCCICFVQVTVSETSATFTTTVQENNKS